MKKYSGTPASNASQAAMAMSAAACAISAAAKAARSAASARSISATAAVYPMCCEEQTYTTRIYIYIYIYIYTATYAISPPELQAGVSGTGAARGVTGTGPREEQTYTNIKTPASSPRAPPRKEGLIGD